MEIKDRAYRMPQDKDEYLDALEVAGMWRPDLIDLAINKYGLSPEGNTWDEPDFDYKDFFNEVRGIAQEEVSRYGYDDIPVEVIKRFGL